MSLGTLALWIACFLLTYTFPLLNAGLGASGSFILYGVICAAGYLYILRNVPETKGVTLEALEEQLAQRHTGRQTIETGSDTLMVDSFILENAHLQMRVNSLGARYKACFPVNARFRFYMIILLAACSR
ncbi:D-xylose transporter XylE [Raoultella planticola]|uniref:D-xylose transporter XylE n=1 Tax=Raoultella planticola TaxID=575 RepID=A0A485BWF1_RAOPL|nr:D-xylose transporter XylE [Raoultella planticola]